MNNYNKFPLKKTMYLMASLGLAYSGAASAAVDGVTCAIEKTGTWDNGFALKKVRVTNNSGAPGRGYGCR